MTNASGSTRGGAPSQKTRSPNYPSVSLRTAVGWLPTLYAAMKRHPVGVDVAVKLMGYSYKSSTGKLALAAMRAFGLFVNERGAGGDSLVKLSSRALDIATDYPEGSPPWQEAVKRAAVTPTVHNLLWARYGHSLPPDDELRRYLIRDLKFNDNTVGDFIDKYKDTLVFANLTGNDKISEDDETPAVGHYVQWTSRGVDQFPIPRRIIEVSDDGEWAFVEGSETGIPMNELAVVDPPAPPVPAKSAQPPTNPHYRLQEATGPRIEFPLPDGNFIEIRLKKPVSKKDFERIKKLVELSEDSLVADLEQEQA